MTNPNNMVRIRSRNGGRASVYEANAWAQTEMPGIILGDGVRENTTADLNVLVGGDYNKPNIVIAHNSAGYKIALDIVSQQAIPITPPATNSRFSLIVAYTDDLALPTTEDTITGSPSSCGLIVVNGATAASPKTPTDADIRAAISADGATGSEASYCVLAQIKVSSDTSAITQNMIKNHFGYGSRGFGEKELIAYVDAVNGDDANDGFMDTTAFKTLGGLFKCIGNCGGKEIKIGITAGSTYNIDGYILNSISLHFQPRGTGTTTINITTLGSNYSFAIYNSHINFQGTATLPIVVTMANTTTANSTFYLDAGNMAAAYTTFNCGVTLWSAGSRFQNCTLNRKLRINFCSVQLQQCNISVIECVAGQIDAWQSVINTNKTDNTDNYYWTFKDSVVAFYGATSVNIDTNPTVTNFIQSNGSTFYFGAVFNKNNSSTRKFSGSNTINGGVVSATSARWNAIKALATSNTLSEDVVKSSGVS